VGTYDAAQMLLVNAADAEVAFGKGSISSDQAELIDDGTLLLAVLSWAGARGLTYSSTFLL
jgi:hypothetical protein